MRVPVLREYQTHVDNFDPILVEEETDLSLEHAAFLINEGHLEKEWYISELSEALKHRLTWLSDEAFHTFLTGLVDRAIRNDTGRWGDFD